MLCRRVKHELKIKKKNKKIRRKEIEVWTT